MNNTVFISIDAASDVLGVDRYHVKKLVHQGLIDTEKDGHSYKLRKADVDHLAPARFVPFLSNIPALVCRMGKNENTRSTPQIFWEKEFPLYRAPDYAKILGALSAEQKDRLESGDLCVVGYWAHTDATSDMLVDTQALVVASYCGFILGGGHVEEELPVRNSYGARAWLARPFDSFERGMYVHTYLRDPEKGVPSKVWTPSELEQRAMDDAHALVKNRLDSLPTP